MAPAAAAELLRQHTRLVIMGILYRHRDVAARRVRQELGLTDGNLASHAQRLAGAGLMTVRNALGPDGFELRYRITPAGSQAVLEFVRELRSLIEAVDDLALPHGAVAAAPKRASAT
ncbi:MAG: transcriptional regulator [Thermoplasmatota archaeon]